MTWPSCEIFENGYAVTRLSIKPGEVFSVGVFRRETKNKFALLQLVLSVSAIEAELFRDHVRMFPAQTLDAKTSGGCVPQLPPCNVTFHQTSVRLEDCDLSDRVFNLLRAAGFKSMFGVAEKSERELLAIRNFGPHAVAEIKKALKIRGIYLRGGGAK